MPTSSLYKNGYYNGPYIKGGANRKQPLGQVKKRFSVGPIVGKGVWIDCQGVQRTDWGMILYDGYSTFSRHFAPTDYIFYDSIGSTHVMTVDGRVKQYEPIRGEELNSLDWGRIIRFYVLPY